MSGREFDLSDVLSIVPGALVSSRHIDGVYDILNYMTGDNLFTHVLPRASRWAAPHLIARFPWLAEIVFPSAELEALPRTRDERAAFCAEWVDGLKAVYGDTLLIEPVAGWHSMDPVQELIEMTERPDRIVVVGS